MIMIAFVVLIVTLINLAWDTSDSPKETYKTSQGTVVVKCISGYKHTVSNRIVTQIMSSEGKGIVCE